MSNVRDFNQIKRLQLETELARYTNIIEKRPKQSSAPYHRATDILEQLGKITGDNSRYDKALELYNDAIKNFPDEARLFASRGKLYSLLGRVDLAAVDLVQTERSGSSGNYVLDMYTTNVKEYIMKLNGVLKEVKVLVDSKQIPAGLESVFHTMIQVMTSTAYKVNDHDQILQNHSGRFDRNEEELRYVKAELIQTRAVLQQQKEQLEEYQALCPPPFISSIKQQIQDIEKKQAIHEQQILETQQAVVGNTKSIQEQQQQYLSLKNDISKLADTQKDFLLSYQALEALVEIHIKQHGSDILGLKEQSSVLLFEIKDREKQHNELSVSIKSKDTVTEAELRALDEKYKILDESQKSFTVRCDQLSQKLSRFDKLLENISTLESLILQEQISTKVANEVSIIEKDDYTHSFYKALRRDLAGIYVASQAIATGMVANDKKGTVEKIGAVVKKAGEYTPLVGVGVKLLGDIIKVAGRYFENKKIERLAHIAIDGVEMSAFAESLAREMIKISLQEKILQKHDTLLQRIWKFTLGAAYDIASTEEGVISAVIPYDHFSKATAEAIKLAENTAEEYVVDHIGEFGTNRAIAVQAHGSYKSPNLHLVGSIKKFFGIGKKLPTSQPQLTQDHDRAEMDAIKVVEAIVSLIYSGRLEYMRSTTIKDKVEELIRLVKDADVIELSCDVADKVFDLIKTRSITDPTQFKWSKDTSLDETFKEMLANAIQRLDQAIFGYIFNKATLADGDFKAHLVEQISKNILDPNATIHIIVETAPKLGHHKTIKGLDKQHLTQDVMNAILLNTCKDVTDLEVKIISHQISHEVLEKIKHDDYVITHHKVHSYTWNTNHLLDDLEKDLSERLTDILSSDKTLIYTAKMSTQFEHKLVQSILHGLVDRDITIISPTASQSAHTAGVNIPISLELNDQFRSNDHFFDPILEEVIKDMTLMG